MSGKALDFLFGAKIKGKEERDKTGFLYTTSDKVGKWINDSLIPTTILGIKNLEEPIHIWVDTTLQWILDECVKWVPTITKSIDDAMYGALLNALPFGLGKKLTDARDAFKDQFISNVEQLKTKARMRSQIYGYNVYSYSQMQGRSYLDDVPKTATDLNKSLTNLKKSSDKLQGNDFEHLKLASEDLTRAFNDLVFSMYGVGGGGGGGGGAARGGGRGAVGGKVAGWKGTKGAGNATWAGAMAGGWSRVFEQYPWEDRSSNYGPRNNYLGVPYEVGLGVNLQKQYGVSSRIKGQNDWVKIQMGDGTVQWRRVLETSARPSGIEFWSSKQGQYIQHGEKARIIGTSHGKPADVTINYHVTNHINGGDNIEGKMAAAHKKHIDQMSKDLGEVVYLHNRANFDGARAV
jgi:hypothetical protein